MSGEDTGDRGDAFVVLLGELVVDLEVKWDGVPEVEPPFGDQGCAYSGYSGQVGDDDVENLVR